MPLAAPLPFRRMRRAYRAPSRAPLQPNSSFVGIERLARPVLEVKSALWFLRAMPLLPAGQRLTFNSSSTCLGKVKGVRPFKTMEESKGPEHLLGYAKFKRHIHWVPFPGSIPPYSHQLSGKHFFHFQGGPFGYHQP